MPTIFCYTSTGNSLHVAKRISGKIGGKVLPMNGALSNLENEIIGFVFPVYFWGLPRGVERFIKEMNVTSQNAYIFAVATYGGVAYGVPGRVNRLLREKGIKLHYGKSLKSVENYIPYYKVNDSEAFQRKVDQNITDITKEIAEKKCDHISSYTILNRIIHRFCPDRYSDRYFTVSSDCTSCRVCEKVCPASNIKIGSVKPDFLHQCDHCLACVHSCPENAIDWKGKTKGKQRYRNPNVSLKELISFYHGEE